MATNAGRLEAGQARRAAPGLFRRLRGAALAVWRQLAWHGARWRATLTHALRGSRLPPGTIGRSCLAGIDRPDYYLERWRRYGPVFKTFWGSGDLKICMVGLARARRLLAAHRRDLQPVTLDISALVPNGFIRGMDPELHPHYRRLFLGGFRDEVVAAWESEIRRIVAEHLSVLAGPAPPGVSPPQRLYHAADRIAMHIQLLVILGARAGTGDASFLEGLYRRLGPAGRVAAIGSEQRAAYAALQPRVWAMVESLRSGSDERPGDSVLSRMVSAGSALDETAIGNVIYMVERGRHDLRDLLRWVVKYLSDHPSVVQELSAADGSELSRACVLETLRLDQAEALNRRVLNAFEFEGYQVPRGSWVSILLRETHQDPGAFPHPECYRPQRFLEREYSGDEYSPFGIGEHQCLAASMVVTVSAWFVEELVRGFRWTVVGDGPRHHGEVHWEPSPQFAIELRRRD